MGFAPLYHQARELVSEKNGREMLKLMSMNWNVGYFLGSRSGNRCIRKCLVCKLGVPVGLDTLLGIILYV